MMRALWTAASGMITQQTNVDNISNNIANVNTTGFKKGEAEFKSLLYQNLQTQSTNSDNVLKPVNAQVGLGVRTAAITTVFTQGNLYESEYNLAFAIEGEGFDLANVFVCMDGVDIFQSSGVQLIQLVDGNHIAVQVDDSFLGGHTDIGRKLF